MTIRYVVHAKREDVFFLVYVSVRIVRQKTRRRVVPSSQLRDVLLDVSPRSAFLVPRV